MVATKRIVILGDESATVEKVPCEENVPAGYLRVKPKYCGICGSDVHSYYEPRTSSSAGRGHEFSAEVVEIGEGVDGFSKGDRVVVEPTVGCEDCENCAQGYPVGCKKLKAIGLWVHGGMSDEVVVPKDVVYKLPDDIDYKTGALTEPIAVVVRAFNLAEIDASTDKVLVMGGGTLGLLSIVVAAHCGLTTLTLTAKYPFQKQLALTIADKLGITLTVLNAGEKPSQAPSVVIETVGGRAPTAREAVEWVQNRGRIVLVGVFQPPSPPPSSDSTTSDTAAPATSDDSDTASSVAEYAARNAHCTLNLVTLVLREVVLKGSCCYVRPGHIHTTTPGDREYKNSKSGSDSESVSPGDFHTALAILQQHSEVVRVVITHVEPLAEAPHAFDMAAHKSAHSAVKVMLEMQ